LQQRISLKTRTMSQPDHQTVWQQVHSDRSIHLDTVPASDRQTDRQTDLVKQYRTVRALHADARYKGNTAALIMLLLKPAYLVTKETFCPYSINCAIVFMKMVTDWLKLLGLFIPMQAHSLILMTILPPNNGLDHSCGAVYCNWSCLLVCVGGSITTITRNCVHRSSPNWVCR